MGIWAGTTASDQLKTTFGIGPETAKGTLTYLTRTEKKYRFLVDGDKWTDITWDKRGK